MANAQLQLRGGGKGTSAAAVAAAAAAVPENERKDQRARLIKALGRFRPDDATPLQFYNCVREVCIMHNCSIDEGLERAARHWPQLSIRQRKLYDSQRHAELPIPVPRHLIYRAFEKERHGLWTLGRCAAATNGQTMYTVEAYKPTPKPTRLKAQLNAKKPKYDNMRSLSPKSAATQSLPSKSVRVSPASGRRIRTLLPPLIKRSAASLRRILSAASIGMPVKKLRKRRRLKKRTRKSGSSPKNQEPQSSASSSGTGCHSGSGSGSGNGSIATNTTGKSSIKQKKSLKPRKSAKKSSKGDRKSGVKSNWHLAIGGVRQNLTKKTL